MHNTLVVEVTRGDLVESRHHVHAVVTSLEGQESWGDAQRLTFPRSAAKIMQAIALVESGAAKRLKLSSKQLALACSSHGGEPDHVTTVNRWLADLGLNHQCLECGESWPFNPAAGREMAASGATPTAAHHTCSGKHTGFLSLARDQGWDTEGYIQPDHRVQQTIKQVSEELMGAQLGVRGTDGCGIPTYANPLQDISQAFFQMTQAQGARQSAVQQLVAAHHSDPFMVGGSGRMCTDVNGLLKDGMVKWGAEGVYCGTFPERQIGLAMKAEDGSQRAAEAALLWLLKRLGLLDGDQLTQRHPEPIYNNAGLRVGEVRVSPV